MRQGTVLRTEPTRRAATIIGVVLNVSASAGLVWLSRNDTARWFDLTRAETNQIRLALGLFGCLVMLLSMASALVNGRRWLLSRAIVRLSRSPLGVSLAPANEWVVQVRGAATIPQLLIDSPGRLRRSGRLRLRVVNAHANIIGQAPLRLAYLRVFDNQPRSRTFLEGAWREFGYVYMLRGATSVSPREYRHLRRNGAGDAFVSTTAELERRLRAARASPDRRGRRVFRDLAPSTIRTRDSYGAYPPIGILCHGAYWREAVDQLLLRVDAVCMDLSGFRAKNQGTGYELQRVVDVFPIERVLFLMDRHSDRRYLKAEIQRAWQHMADGSPNSGSEPRRTHVATTDYFRTVVQRNSQGAETSRQTRLMTRRRETRRLAAWFQGALAAAQPWSGAHKRALVEATYQAMARAGTPALRTPAAPRRRPWGWLGASVLLAATTVGSVSTIGFLGDVSVHFR